jgi:crotonobetainyl-CoA:carnitine CoA-transferase CaiB-like acyl-CoA transferase
MNYIALAGVLSLIGEKKGPPYLPSNLIADMAGAGLHGCIGILLALAAREKTERGQYIDISYMDGAISLLAYEAAQYFGTGRVPKRGETSFTGAVPWINVYRCKDGEYYTLAALEPHLYANFCRAVGREDLVSKQYASDEENERIKTELRAIFLTKTRDEWFEFFKDKDTCTGPVYYLSETFKDPQVIHRKMVVDVPHSQLGAVKQTGIPIKLSDTPGEIRSAGVPAGTHTREILTGLGYSGAEIESLKSVNAIGFGVEG